MKITEVIRRPLVTEKTTVMKEDGRTLVFEVARQANKLDVKRAVEKLLGPKVASVRTSDPYLDEIAGMKDYGAAGIAYVYASLEYYADLTVGYCEYEVDAPIVPIDLGALATDYEFTGEAVTEGDRMFGAWTIVDNDITYYVLASVTPELYHLQVTWVLGNPANPAASK